MTDNKPTNEPTGPTQRVAPTRASDTSYVVSRWAFLPPHIREAIVTLVDAGLANAERQPDQFT